MTDDMGSFRKLVIFYILYNTVAVGYEVTYEPAWQSLDTRPLPQWFDDAKFGILIHWGVYSVPSFENELFWIKLKEGSPNHAKFMKENYPPGFTYQEFAKDFKAEFFDPESWANLFKKAGAKYVILTCKHGDGYTLWPSAYSFNWNVKDVGPHRDLVGDLANAIRNKTNLKFGLHYMLNEWFNPMYLADKASNFQNSTYVDNKITPELLDIVNKYHPEIVWSNGDWEASYTYWKSTEFLAWLYNDSPVKDTVVVNNNWGSGTTCNSGKFCTCFAPDALPANKGEVAMSIDKNSWGYKRNSNIEEYRTTHELVVVMAKTISCGGNLLLNIGPTSDGRIIPIFQERLLEIGEWLSINGEAIYSSKPWTYKNEPNTNVWYTAKDTAVYAIVLVWPNDNELKLKVVLKLFENDSPTVTLLGNSEKLKWNKSDDLVRFIFPDKATVKSRWAWVLKIETKPLDFHRINNY